VTAFFIILGLLLIGTCGWLIARVIALPRLQVASHLRSVGSYGFGQADADRGSLEPQSLLTGTLAGKADAFGAALIAKLPRVPHLTRGQLCAAGIYKLTPEAVHGYRAMAAIGAPVGLLLLAVLGGGLSGLMVILILVLAALAWQGPAILIGRRGRQRLDEIDRTLPQLVDLVVATVEAGVGFGAALTSVASRFTGPLGDELRLTLQQQSLGISVERSLTDLAERCDTTFIRAFVRTVIRAEAHGISIGPVLRHLATDIRNRRRDAAREKIQKAPAKMLIPLMVFILLPLMLVIFFPAGWNLMHTLGGTV
jgi:tight adherence protein C